MNAPEIPIDEFERLRDLEDAMLWPFSDELTFDRLVNIAKIVFDVPVSEFNLVFYDAVVTKASAGPSESALRSESICGHTILKSEPLIVEDTLKDPRFYDNPRLLIHPPIRFYAGQAVLGPNGRPIGTFCILDHRPRTLSALQIDLLADFAAVVTDLIKARRLTVVQKDLVTALTKAREEGHLDPMLRIWNKSAITELLSREVETAKRTGRDLALIFADLDHFKDVNDSEGHLAGDQVLLEAVRRIRSVLRSADGFGRYGGEEFLIILPETNQAGLDLVAHKILEAFRFKSFSISNERVLSITISLGGWAGKLHSKENPEKLIEYADNALYKVKQSGRNGYAS